MYTEDIWLLSAVDIFTIIEEGANLIPLAKKALTMIKNRREAIIQSFNFLKNFSKSVLSRFGFLTVVRR